MPIRLLNNFQTTLRESYSNSRSANEPGPDAKIVYHYFTYTLVEELGLSFNKVIRLIQQQVEAKKTSAAPQTGQTDTKIETIEKNAIKATAPSVAKPNQVKPLRGVTKGIAKFLELQNVTKGKKAAVPS